MSVCVTIKTTESLEPNTLLKHLADKGEQIFVISNEFPFILFGKHLKAICGVGVAKTDDRYEVNVQSFASVEDYKIFVQTITAITELTGGSAYYENDEGEIFENPTELFDEEWIEQQRETCFMMTRAFNRNNNTVVFKGLFCNICIGPKLLAEFGIPLSGEYQKGYMDTLQDYLCSVQWEVSDLSDTSTHMVIRDASDNDELTISMITVKNGKVREFDYISEAQLFGIIHIDDDGNIPVLIPFKELWKILPENIFRPLDELQYLRTGELTAEMVYEMMDKAMLFQPEDLHHNPIYPGEGYDENQNTFILMWNPAISSVKLEDHNVGVKNMLTEYFNWSIWEHEYAKCGDRFFLVRVGEGNTGIVMSGVFDSRPYETGDWSGKGRKTFYMDMIPNVILNPETAPMITTEELYKEIPSFNWSGGHSGRLLPKEDAKALERLWSEYLEKNAEHIDYENMNAININCDY